MLLLLFFAIDLQFTFDFFIKLLQICFFHIFVI